MTREEITITLEGEALEMYHAIMYELPLHADGSGMVSPSDAISYALTCLRQFENKMEMDILTFLNDQK